jgi:branched-chain amino acid transport system permease protein
MPVYLTGQITVLGLDVGVYRLFLIAMAAAITLALVLGLERTRFGAMIRAAVDSPAMAVGLGIDVDRVFSITFMVGSGLAGLGGALGVNLVGLEPGFPIKYMVYFLIVVAVGGLGSIKGSLIAALLLGICDVAGKYYAPETGAFIIYVIMVSLLLWRPIGLFGRRS